MKKKLEDLGFNATLETDVLMSEVDEEASLHNQARLGGAFDPAVVDSYALKISEGGEVFPAIVVWERSGGQPLLIVDGNHRFQAWKKLGWKHCDMYIIRGAEPAAVNMFMYTVNTEHGVPTDEATRIQHAIAMVDRGITVKAASTRLGVPRSKIDEALKQADASRRADANGINRVRWDKLSAAHRKRLATFETDELFKAMTQLTLDAGLTLEDLARARAELEQITSHKNKMSYVAGLRETFAPQIQTGGRLDGRGPGSQRVTARMVFSLALGQVSALPSANAIVERVTGQEKPQLIERTLSAIERLTAVLDELKK